MTKTDGALTSDVEYYAAFDEDAGETAGELLDKPTFANRMTGDTELTLQGLKYLDGELSATGFTFTLTDVTDPDKPDPIFDPEPQPPAPPEPVPEEPETEIPDTDVPLTSAPEEPTEEIEEPDVPLVDVPTEEVPTEEIPTEDVPLADVPKTGDNSGLWVALTAASGMGLAALAIAGRKRKSELD